MVHSSCVVYLRLVGCLVSVWPASNPGRNCARKRRRTFPCTYLQVCPSPSVQRSAFSKISVFSKYIFGDPSSCKRLFSDLACFNGYFAFSSGSGIAVPIIQTTTGSVVAPLLSMAEESQSSNVPAVHITQPGQNNQRARLNGNSVNSRVSICCAQLRFQLVSWKVILNLVNL